MQIHIPEWMAENAQKGNDIHRLILQPHEYATADCCVPWFAEIKKKISSQNGFFYEDANLLNYFDPSKNSFDRNDMREQKLTLNVVQHQFARRAPRFLVYFMSGCVAWIVSMPHRMPYTVLKAIWCDGRYKDILRKGHAEISVVFIVLQ